MRKNILKITNRVKPIQLSVLMIMIFLANIVLACNPVSKPDGDEGQEEVQTPRVEVVFCLDATGSMSGLISTAKEKIWSIANNLASAEPAPELYMGLVFYRDRGDAFVTKFYQLTDDLDKLYSELMNINAGGGGDGPESVNQALHEAIDQIEWNQDDNTYRTVFLVGDFPPHMDYQDDVKYHETCKIAKEKDITINAVQMGLEPSTTPIWKEIASLTNGEYFQVDANANGYTVNTPFDDDLIELSRQLEDTRIYYGDKEAKSRGELKDEVSEKNNSMASKEALARRAIYMNTASGKKSFFGQNELIYEIENNNVKVEDIEKNQLPDNMVDMTLEEREKYVNKLLVKRKEIEKQIAELEIKRQEYIKKQMEEAGKADSETFSGNVMEAVKEQSESKKIHYDTNIKH
jgi:hypothetical protein